MVALYTGCSYMAPLVLFLMAVCCFGIIVESEAALTVTELLARHIVAIKTRHTNTSLCTHGAGGDTPQLAPREADL